MIVKCKRKQSVLASIVSSNEPSWKMFDHVNSPEWAYFSIEDIKKVEQLKSFAESLNTYCIDKKSAPNFVCLTFWRKGQYHIIFSNQSVYLENDEGITLENLTA